MTDWIWPVTGELALRGRPPTLHLSTLREVLGADAVEAVIGAMNKRGMLFSVDGRAWVDSDVWELAHGGEMQAWELLEGAEAGDILSLVALGGPGDSSWSPMAVLERVATAWSSDLRLGPSTSWRDAQRA